ncbi:MAG: hypothetical protein Q7K42_03390 [Candidatus Diapherotrites archaeon]|nr:hypothetical protein [Candidatus Diapherotrites archaeon]
MTSKKLIPLRLQPKIIQALNIAVQQKNSLRKPKDKISRNVFIEDLILEKLFALNLIQHSNPKDVKKRNLEKNSQEITLNFDKDTPKTDYQQNTSLISEKQQDITLTIEQNTALIKQKTATKKSQGIEATKSEELV